MEEEDNPYAFLLISQPSDDPRSVYRNFADAAGKFLKNVRLGLAEPLHVAILNGRSGSWKLDGHAVDVSIGTSAASRYEMKVTIRRSDRE